MTSIGNAMRGALAFLLLPLSLVPLYFAIPKIRSEVALAEPDRAAFDAPDARAQRGAARALAAAAGDPRRRAGARLPRRERAPGTTTRSPAGSSRSRWRCWTAPGSRPITIAEYVRFLQGTTINLPKRPILITFDDGRLDSYRGADRILAEHGFRATMFTIAGFVEEHNSFYLTWDELRRMASSSGWDMQEHAGVGHVNVRYDAAGHEGRPTPTASIGPGAASSPRRSTSGASSTTSCGRSGRCPSSSRLQPAQLRCPVRKLRPGPHE